MHLTETNTIPLVVTKDVARVDSRLLAANMQNKHKATMALIERYQTQLRAFGQLPFKKEVGERAQGGGNPERYALLNEDQAFQLVALSRNTARVVELKFKLVKAFGEARRAAEAHNTEYLPTYHALHDELHTLAAGSPHERFIHSNMNALVNKAVGIASGQRGALPSAPKALMVVAQLVAAKAAHAAPDHKQAYARAKQALAVLALSTATNGALAP
jgi:phage regulator Rha-like protein